MQTKSGSLSSWLVINEVWKAIPGNFSSPGSEIAIPDTPTESVSPTSLYLPSNLGQTNLLLILEYHCGGYEKLEAVGRKTGKSGGQDDRSGEGIEVKRNS